MAEDALIITREDRLCILTLNRPEKRNALTPELLKQLEDTFVDLSRTDEIRTVVIRGAGKKAFCAGYDIGVLPSGERAELAQEALVKSPLEATFRSMIAYPYPIIAMMGGAAFGAGLELALCADVRVAAEGIRMAMPPAKIGLVYSPEGLGRFIRCIGPGATRELFFTGDAVSGERILRMGLADHMVPREELQAFTLKMARRMAANAPLALKGIKRITHMLTEFQALPPHLAREAESLMAEAWRSEDFREGRRAFLEGRPPLFTGR